MAPACPAHGQLRRCDPRGLSRNSAQEGPLGPRRDARSRNRVETDYSEPIDLIVLKPPWPSTWRWQDRASLLRPARGCLCGPGPAPGRRLGPPDRPLRRPFPNRPFRFRPFPRRPLRHLCRGGLRAARGGMAACVLRGRPCTQRPRSAPPWPAARSASQRSSHGSSPSGFAPCQAGTRARGQSAPCARPGQDPMDERPTPRRATPRRPRPPASPRSPRSPRRGRGMGPWRCRPAAAGAFRSARSSFPRRRAG